ncbi:MAG: GNAT family N-acetyltransferase [Nitrosomonas sp.]|nr:GNAT family N-acetyltransferase [Nitrosomonas sp.]
MSTTKNYQLAQNKQVLEESNVIAFSRTAASPYKNLTFPLNVYAHAMLLQEGIVNYLHYGLFQHGNTDLSTAQQFSTELVISRLPTPSCRILEVGIGLGTTFSRLMRLGYNVYGLTPDAQQIAHVHQKLGNDVPISCQRLEDFTADAESYDAMLFQESAQYIEPLVIFNKAVDLLTKSGSLIIIDEFALKRVDENEEGLHLLDDMIAQAKRFGFELVEQLNLSEMATPTLDYLLCMTVIHRQRLIQDLDLSEAQLAQLDESNRAYQKKYLSGRFGYGLLHFRKKTRPKWRLRLLEQDQAPEMLALFKKTFHHTMTPATWQWKYGSELNREIGIWRDHQLIAHYGGISRDILLFGHPQVAAQIGDVMVDISERGVLTRQGPFFLMAATFLERFIGYGKPYLIGFGFPNERAMKVAERLGLYAEVGRMAEFTWQPLPKLPRWGTRLRLVENNNNSWAVKAVDECWRQMASDLQGAIVGVRDWHYVQRRYLNHPCQQYQVIVAKSRFGEKINGTLILRHDTDSCEIVDVIASLEEITLLITHARRLAGIANRARVYCRITENFAAPFAIAKGIRQPLNIRIPANAWSDGPKPETLKNCWWLMSGDMDFR